MTLARQIEIRTQDGACSEAALYDAACPRAVIVLTPAMGVPARFYGPLAIELTRSGIAVMVSELRGIGSSSIRARRGVDYGYLELVSFDLPAVIAAARAAHPGAPVWLAGHSLGGHVSVMYASINRGAVAGIVLLASGTSYFKNWPLPGNLVVLGTVLLVRTLSALLGYFPGRRLGFGGTEARRFMHEWAGLTTSGLFRVAGSREDFEHRLAELALPILALSFEGDRFAPKTAVRHLLSKMPLATARHRHLLASDLGAISLDHFRWARVPQPVADLISRWVAGDIREGADA